MVDFSALAKAANYNHYAVNKGCFPSRENRIYTQHPSPTDYSPEARHQSKGEAEPKRTWPACKKAVKPSNTHI